MWRHGKVFGCAVLRIISEQSKESAEVVGKMARKMFVAAMASCIGHASLHEEASGIVAGFFRVPFLGRGS